MMRNGWIVCGLLLIGLGGCGPSASSLFSDSKVVTDGAMRDAAAADGGSAVNPMDASGNVDTGVVGSDASTADVVAESAEAAPVSRPDATADSSPPVADSAATSDAPEGPDALCNRVCAGKGTCSGGECVIRCEAKDGCSDRVECPPSVPCRVVCAGDGSCGAGVDCTQASACDIQCTGLGSCNGIVQCAGSKCTVGCVEQETCARMVNCNADSCDLQCNGGKACSGGVACGAPTKTCSLNCGGEASCLGSVQGRGSSEIICSGHGSCPGYVNCTGDKCSIFCTRGQSCGGSICCQSTQCTYTGADRTCQ